MSSGSLEEDTLGWNLGRYTLHGEIASGGMATVHIGQMVGSAGFTKMVAIKRLHAQFASDPDFVAMFLDEARLAARVYHPNVVQPLDVITTDGEVFLVMEYVRGESLSKIQRILRPRGQRPSIKIVGAIMVGVLHGLHAAHEATSERGAPLGIVHRDVSPQNVLVGTDGTARVLDFGIAKATDRAHSTREGDLKGKLAYMSPEQLTGAADVDRRTDVFAASVVLWELLTGRRLFDSDYQSILVSHTRGEAVQAPSAFAPDVPARVDQIVRKGLARDPSHRFSSAREMAIALEIAMPLATPSKVGEWVEEIAGDSLLKRAARIAEIEQERSPASAHEHARALIHELRIAQTRQTGQPQRRAIATAARSSAGDVRGAASEAATSVLEASAILVEPLQPVSEVHRRDTPTPRFAHPGSGAERRGGGDTTVTAPAVPGVMRAPDAKPLHRAATGRIEAFVRSRNVVRAVLALAVGVLALGLFALLLPIAIKRSYVKAAAKHGIALTVDDIELSLHNTRLLECTVTFPEIPGVLVRIKALDFSMAKGGRSALAVQQPEATIDGPYASILDAVNLYLTAHPFGETPSDRRALERLAIERGHVVWTRAFGEGTKLELVDIGGESARTNDRGLGKDYAFEANRIAIGTPVGEIGPWRGTLTRTAGSIVANVTLSAEGGEPATATYIAQGVDAAAGPGLVMLEVKIPRAPVEKIGIPKAMLGFEDRESFQVEGTLRGARAGGSKLEVQSAFALYGVPLRTEAVGARFGTRADGTPAPANVRFQARVGGNSNEPLDIDGGVMTFGPFRARLRGKATLLREGFRIDGAWRSAPRACDAAADPGSEITIPELAADAAGLDRAIAAPLLSTETTASGVFVLDSRDLGHTHMTAAVSNRCE